MAHAYCTLAEVKSSLSGDVPNMGTSHDQSLVNKILEVSRDIDRKIGHCREDSTGDWSFYADRSYGSQIVTLSATPTATEGTFTLTFGVETTVPIVFDADNESVRVALTMLASVGDGNVFVGGNPGGPWVVTFGGSLTGPQPTLSGFASVVPTDASVVVLPVVSGVLHPFSERLFSAVPTVYAKILPIDDCVEISEVRSLDASDAAVAYSEPANYRRYPLRGLPVEGLKATLPWPEHPTVMAVTARWGYGDTIPEDVREATVIEVIRSHFSALAGNDDRLGMTPYGSVITSKAFTSKFQDLVKDYGNKLW